MLKIQVLLFGLILLTSCSYQDSEVPQEVVLPSQTSILILGIAQDAGFPQADCSKSCCQKYYNGFVDKKMVSSICLIDSVARKFWIIDATPDFPEQLQLVKSKLYPYDYELAGVLLTHAHIGHYTGLMHLGREVMNAKEVPVYAMPRMREFLRNNGPWSQLVALGNIRLESIEDQQPVELSDHFTITPMSVPHRDEYSETVGYNIKGRNSNLLFIPDIDKWEKWSKSIQKEVQGVKFALLDGSFYANGEIPGRDMSEIPHPFIEESIQYFDAFDTVEKAKIGFIHFNHTNPVIDQQSLQYNQVLDAGMWVAEEGQLIGL